MSLLTVEHLDLRHGLLHAVRDVSLTVEQGEILALLLGDPDLELSLTEIASRLGVPHPSVYREIQRAEQAGLVSSRKIGNTRLVRANTVSPYYAGLAEVLTRAFGVPAVLAEALRDVDGRARPRRTGPRPALCRPQHRRAAPGQASAGNHPRPRLAGVRIRCLPRHDYKPARAQAFIARCLAEPLRRRRRQQRLHSRQGFLRLLDCPRSVGRRERAE